MNTKNRMIYTVIVVQLFIVVTIIEFSLLITVLLVDCITYLKQLNYSLGIEYKFDL